MEIIYFKLDDYGNFCKFNDKSYVGKSDFRWLGLYGNLVQTCLTGKETWEVMYDLLHAGSPIPRNKALFQYKDHLSDALLHHIKPYNHSKSERYVTAISYLYLKYLYGSTVLVSTVLLTVHAHTLIGN